ncbi:MAG: biopolymer transporter ExbD [Rhodobacteraceae bacterium]|nr:biopolymer transporter ExbD [Paracoccaceae bacterium]
MISQPRRHRRRPSLTPLIDIVFLLLVFFMVASRFGLEGAVPLPLRGGNEVQSAELHVIRISPDLLVYNGQRLNAQELVSTLTHVQAERLIMRAMDGADVQTVIDVAALLTDNGFTNLVLVE